MGYLQPTCSHLSYCSKNIFIGIQSLQYTFHDLEEADRSLMSLSGLPIQVYLDLSTVLLRNTENSDHCPANSTQILWTGQKPKYQIASTSFANMPDIILALILIACVPQRKTILQAPSRYYTHIWNCIHLSLVMSTHPHTKQNACILYIVYKYGIFTSE